MKSIRTASLVLTAGISVSAHANLILDGGFESPIIGSGNAQFINGPGSAGAWTVVGAQVALVDTAYAEPANGITAFNSQEGNQWMDLTGAGNNGLSSGVHQSIATTLGGQYSLSFWVGRADGNSFFATPSTVDLSIDGGARVGYTNSDATPGFMNWKQFTVNFVASGASTNIAFYCGNTDNAAVGVDNVEVVPEPGTLLACGVGVAGLARRRKKA